MIGYRRWGMPSRRPWRKSPDFPDHPGRFDDVGDAYLDAVASDIEGFGETGQRGFSDAWAETTDGLDNAAAAFATDETDIKGRDLDARSGAWKVAVGLLVILGAGAGWAYSQGLFDTEPTAVADALVTPSLIAPDALREYDSEPTSVVLATTSNGDAMFVRGVDESNPQPIIESVAPLVESFSAGPVLWGGRTHIALTGPGLSDPELCLVATLVSVDLRTVDFAATGNCPDTFESTGDRLACRGPNAVLLEVWPFDPRAATKPPAATAIRFRAERTDGTTVISQRGTVALPGAPEGDALLVSAAVLGGSPGDLVTIDGHECTLVDRSDLLIQLLPS